MIRRTQHGFTIIEVLLVVSISGALITALLLGSGSAINQQRYRDSVTTLKSYIQNQYDQVSNTTNTRTGAEGCASTATIVVTPPEAPGTSDCVLIGRFVTVAANGKDLSAASVVAYRNPATQSLSGASDIADLATYKLGVVTATKEADAVAWSATIVKKGTTTPQGFSMLIVRAPLSGSLITFTSATVMTDLNALVATAGASTTTRDLCVSPASVTLAARLAVQIPKGASNQGSIQIPPASSAVCD